MVKKKRVTLPKHSMKNVSSMPHMMDALERIQPFIMPMYLKNLLVGL